MTMNGQASTGDQGGVESGDPEWVADLFEAFREADLDVAVADLDALLHTFRKAAKARRVLMTIQPSLLRRGLEISATRRRAQR